MEARGARPQHDQETSCNGLNEDYGKPFPLLLAYDGVLSAQSLDYDLEAAGLGKQGQRQRHENYRK